MKVGMLDRGLLLVVSLCVVVTIPGLVHGQAKVGTVTIATDATWPPMEMVDANKKIVGFDIDFMNAVAKEAGFQVEYRNTAWDGIFGGLEAKKYDAIISSVLLQRSVKRSMIFQNPMSMSVRFWSYRRQQRTLRLWQT